MTKTSWRHSRVTSASAGGSAAVCCVARTACSSGSGDGNGRSASAPHSSTTAAFPARNTFSRACANFCIRIRSSRTFCCALVTCGGRSHERCPQSRQTFVSGTRVLPQSMQDLDPQASAALPAPRTTHALASTSTSSEGWTPARLSAALRFISGVREHSTIAEVRSRCRMMPFSSTLDASWSMVASLCSNSSPEPKWSKVVVFKRALEGQRSLCLASKQSAVSAQA